MDIKLLLALIRPLFESYSREERLYSIRRWARGPIGDSYIDMLEQRDPIPHWRRWLGEDHQIYVIPRYEEEYPTEASL